MKVILVPGFWLDASSWDAIVPTLQAAGHDVEALTLPGLERDHPDRSTVTMQDQVDFVIGRIDAADGPVVLVGHSGGGNVISGAIDARLDRVARGIYVDTKPAGNGDIVNDGFNAVNGEIPLPDWSDMDEPDMRGMDDATKAAFRARAVPEPARVATDPLRVVNDERRRAVPTTVINCAFPSAKMREFMQPDHEWYAYTAELAKMTNLDMVDLETGHWPQFTRPAELAKLILDAIAAT